MPGTASAIGAHDRVADEVGEADLAAAVREVAVDDLAVDLEQLGRHVAEARGGGDVEADASMFLTMLRVAAAVRAAEGREAVGDFYTAAGRSIFDRPRVEGDDRSWMGGADHVRSILEAAGLPSELAAAADDPSHDVVIRAETEEALAWTGRDVGTPIIVIDPPNGPGIFGPVISRVPDDDEAVALWESVVHLAGFPGFAELKRSLREVPQLAMFEPPVPAAD
jgi:hypothetical protein